MSTRALLVYLVVVAGASFWAGFRAPRVQWRHLARAAFLVAVPLIGLVAFLLWREAGTLDDIRAIIDPVPEVVSVTVVPRVDGPDASGAAQRWIVRTRLSPDSALSFSAAALVRGGWRVVERTAAALLAEADGRTLLIGVSPSGEGAEVLYTLAEVGNTRRLPTP